MRDRVGKVLYKPQLFNKYADIVLKIPNLRYHD